MTVSTATPRPGLGLGPHALAQRVPCTICGTPTGAPCVDAEDAARPDPHHSRWIRYQHLMRRRPFTAVLRRHIGDGLEPGDVVLCVTGENSDHLDLLVDGLGRRADTGPIDPREVDFQAFIADTGAGARRSPVGFGRRPARRVL